MIEDETGIFDFEEYVIAFEYLLQVAVAKLSYEIYVIEIVNGLIFGNQDFDHADDVGVLAIF